MTVHPLFISIKCEYEGLYYTKLYYNEITCTASYSTKLTHFTLFVHGVISTRKFEIGRYLPCPTWTRKFRRFAPKK